MTRLTAITVLMLGSLLPVGSAAEDSHASVEAESYRAEFEAWKSERITRLRAEDGWLSLAGLLWLQEGENSFGPAVDLLTRGRRSWRRKASAYLQGGRDLHGSCAPALRKSLGPGDGMSMRAIPLVPRRGQTVGVAKQHGLLGTRYCQMLWMGRARIQRFQAAFSISPSMN